MALLEVVDVRVVFGGVVALDGLSFEVQPGQIAALIGPNGAGKTTLFNVVSRLYEPTEGKVRYRDTNIVELPSHRIAQLGIARTFQNLALVPGLSVLDNVAIGTHCRHRRGFLEGMLLLRSGADRRARAAAMELLERLDLRRYADLPCAGLPFGTLKRIEIARALAASPELLLLDEPASGLTHSEVGELGQTIRSIRDELDLTVVLVEHHMSMVMSISDRIVVMEYGVKIAEGTPGEVQSNPRVIEAYLGTES